MAVAIQSYRDLIVWQRDRIAKRDGNKAAPDTAKNEVAKGKVQK